MSLPIVQLDVAAIKTPTSNQRGIPLGARGVTKDGRVFRYARANEALTAGYLIFSKAPTEWQFATNAPITTDSGTIAVTATTIKLSSTWSAFTGTTGTTGVVANTFKDGYLFVTKGTGLGQYVRVESNTTGSTGTAAQSVTFTLKDETPLSAALSTANEIVVTHNMYDKVVQNLGEASQTSAVIPVGVTVCAVTIDYYFWLQTWGPAVVLVEGTVAIGELVANSTDAATTGAVGRYALNASATGLDLLGALRRPPIGTVLVAAPDAEMSVIDLHIAP